MDYKIKLKLNGKFFDWIVGFLFFSISNISRLLLQFLEIPREVSYAVYLIFFTLYFLKYIRKFKVFDFLYYLIVIPVVAYGVVNYAKYIDSNSSVLAILILFLPSFLFFRFYDKDMMVETFIYAQYLAVPYLLVYYITTVTNLSKYSMDYGYWIIIPICTMSYLYFERKRLRFLVLMIVMLLTLVLAGSRAPLLLGLLCVMYFYVMKELAVKKDARWFAKIFCVFSICLFLILNATTITLLIGKFSGQSRTIDRLLEGNLFSSSTRTILYSRVQSLIDNKPSGYGPLASRMYLSGYPYPHSIIYEMQLDYGVIIGLIISVAIIIIGILNLLCYRKGPMRLVVGYIEIVGLGSLLVSTSYFYEMYVPATIALFSVSKVYLKRQRDRPAHRKGILYLHGK